MMLLVAMTLVAAGIPPALDEDRSEPGFCSPDCPLQQALHTAAVTPESSRRDDPAEAVGEPVQPDPVRAYPPATAAPDAPRAPPLA